MRKKSVISGFLVLLMLFGIIPLSMADVDTSKPWFPLQYLAACNETDCSRFSAKADSDGNGYIDKADSVSEPAPADQILVDIGYWHPVSQIAISNDNLTSVDNNSNGWPDICDNISRPPESEQVEVGFMYEPLYMISMSYTGLWRIDSDENGWPDKCDCILSELDTDDNNCGECGNVCVGGNPKCCDSSCRDLDTDDDHCGDCNNACGLNSACSSASCSCNIDYQDCNGAGDGTDADGCECYTGGSNICDNNACCTPEAKATTCSGGVCGIVQNNCNQDVDCGACCTPDCSSTGWYCTSSTRRCYCGENDGDPCLDSYSCQNAPSDSCVKNGDADCAGYGLDCYDTSKGGQCYYNALGSPRLTYPTTCTKYTCSGGGWSTSTYSSTGSTGCYKDGTPSRCIDPGNARCEKCDCI